MRKTKFFFICCFLLLASASGVFAQQDDKLLQVLKDELNKEMQELQKTENPPYHMNFRVMDEKVVNISANFGVLQGVREQHTRTLVPQVRVGSMELDNFKYNPMGSPTTTRTSSSMAYLPIEGDNWEDAIRQAIWAETESRYEFAVESYQQAKTKSTVSVADEDKAPCFSEAPVEKYYEAPLPADKQTIDKEVWEKRMKEVSAAFKEFPQLQMGTAGITFKVLRTYFVNTEGTEVVQNRTYARVMLSATLIEARLSAFMTEHTLSLFKFSKAYFLHPIAASQKYRPGVCTYPYCTVIVLCYASEDRWLERIAVLVYE